ncbi:MAG: hypothetical protein EOP83_14985 [Verrucomicrobiaceae bacterium]|nr:MAG: hypothetical protein EOP83_14985 [Verrucomicrobiaceae bacterium]
MNRIIAAGGLSIVGLTLLGLVSLTGIFKKRPPHVRSETINHAKQLHLALLDFENDFGCFPDSSTIADVKDDTGTSLPLGNSTSNELLRQLIAFGNKSERIYWAESATSRHKPDDNIQGTHALEKSECGFAYVTGLSSSSDPSIPILLAPVDASHRRFERKSSYEDKALVLFVDGSWKVLPIDKHGNIQLNGMNILDPRQPFWKGKAPDIKWPE